MKMKYGNIWSWTVALSVVAVLLSAVAGCVREDFDVERDSEPSDPEGVDLVCYIDVEDLVSSLELETRAGDRDPWMNADIDNLSSLAFFVVEENGPIVAYRIIAPADTGDDKFYVNKDPREPAGSQIKDSDVLMSRAALHEIMVDKGVTPPTQDTDFCSDSYHDDDQHYGCWHDTPTTTGFKLKDNCVGYNGFAKLEGNKLVMANYGGTEYPAYDGWNKADPVSSTKPDGVYDDDYTDTVYPFKSYASGDWMRKGGAIILTFKYDNPMHGPVEKLKRGNYYLLAVANFRESVSNVVQHDGNGEFTEDVSDNGHPGHHIFHIINHWDPEKGVKILGTLGSTESGDHQHDHTPYGFIDGAASLSDIRVLSTGQLANPDGTTDNISSSFIRSNKARILMSGYQKITLTPGNTNVVAYNVIRTTTRVTFRVNNYSAKELTLTGFSLSNNFAQAATFLFHDESQHSKLYREVWQGAPVVNSEKAIVPFPPLNPDGTESDAGFITVPAYTNNHVFFDALIYESGNVNDPLGYKLTLEYTDSFGEVLSKSLGGDTEYVKDEHITTAAGLLSDIGDVGDSKVYLLDSRGTYNFEMGFMYYNSMTDAVMGSRDLLNPSNFNEGVDDSFKWEIKRVSETEVTIKSIAANRYLSAPAEYNNLMPMGLTENENDAQKFVVGSTGEFEIAFIMPVNNNNQTGYLHANTDKYDATGVESCEIVYHTPTGSNSAFYVYKTDQRDVIYPIEVFNKDVGVSERLYTLHRNDHLVVDIGVTYNEETQNVDFEVMPWQESKNEIEFN